MSDFTVSEIHIKVEHEGKEKMCLRLECPKKGAKMTPRQVLAAAQAGIAAALRSLDAS